MELIGVERIGEGSAKVPVTGCIAMGLATGVASLVLGMKGGDFENIFWPQADLSSRDVVERV